MDPTPRLPAMPSANVQSCGVHRADASGDQPLGLLKRRFQAEEGSLEDLIAQGGAG